MAMATLIFVPRMLEPLSGHNLKVIFQENSCICMCQLHVVSADVVRYGNDSTRYSPLRALSQYIAFKKSKLNRFFWWWRLTSSGHLRTSTGKMPNHPHDMSANYTGNLKRFKCSSFRLTDLFFRRVMQKSNLFYLWHVDKGMIHEPTQRFKGLLGDICDGLLTVYLVPTHSLLLSIALW